MLYSRKVRQIDSFQAFGVRKFGELIVSTTLYGFSLVNHNLPNPPNSPPHQTFPLYGMFLSSASNPRLLCDGQGYLPENFNVLASYALV